jgi:hypothetical protein
MRKRLTVITESSSRVGGQSNKSYVSEVVMGVVILILILNSRLHVRQ